MTKTTDKTQHLTAPPWDELLASLGLAPSTPAPPANPAECDCLGDRPAYQQHIRRAENPCAKSRSANTAYQRQLYGRKPRIRSECGSYPGYQAHARRGEEICGGCAEARRERDRAAYAARRAARAA